MDMPATIINEHADEPGAERVFFVDDTERSFLWLDMNGCHLPVLNIASDLVRPSRAANQSRSRNPQLPTFSKNR